MTFINYKLYIAIAFVYVKFQLQTTVLVNVLGDTLKSRTGRKTNGGAVNIVAALFNTIKIEQKADSKHQKSPIECNSQLAVSCMRDLFDSVLLVHCQSGLASAAVANSLRASASLGHSSRGQSSVRGGGKESADQVWSSRLKRKEKIFATNYSIFLSSRDTRVKPLFSLYRKSTRLIQITNIATRQIHLGWGLDQLQS